MKKAILRTIVLSLFASAILTSCVTQRKYQELEAKKQRCDEESTKLRAENLTLTTKTNEQAALLESNQRKIEALERDTSTLGTSWRRTTANYDQLNKTYQLLLEKNQELLAGNAAETQKILAELQKTQEDLYKREEVLKKLESELEIKRKNIEQMGLEISEKEKRINEMQAILTRKDSAVNALRAKVANALLGYENNGLTILQKHGKVYVSLDEKLLFASGSFTIDPKGLDALKKLGKVLENNPDINIMIEGHTDVVPYKGTGQIKDNWDLSVMRATTVVKALLSGSKIDPKRLVAAGRSEYTPVDPADTKEARAKNRRTEIILTPKLDELLRILETN